MKRGMIKSADEELSITKQCQLLGVAKSVLYYKKRPMKERDKIILNKIDEIYTKMPYYGARRISKELKRVYKLKAGREKVGRMMEMLGIKAIYPKKRMSIRNKEHRIYPYLLKGVEIGRANVVWSADITYIRLRGSYVYLVAIIDWYSRYVLSYRISQTLGSSFCKEAVREAIKRYGMPEYFNTDQGSQFTDRTFVEILELSGIKVSMDGKGRVYDNIFVERLWRTVKYENIYLMDYETVFDCEVGLKKYFAHYNNERIHQALDYETPAGVYLAGMGLRKAS